jgi:hypothetical protein
MQVEVSADQGKDEDNRTKRGQYAGTLRCEANWGTYPPEASIRVGTSFPHAGKPHPSSGSGQEDLLFSDSFAVGTRVKLNWFGSASAMFIGRQAKSPVKAPAEAAG